MRKCNFLMVVLMALFLLFGIRTDVMAADKPLDEIQDYELTVNMRTDGTMDIRYDIEWLVLDGTSEGPLEWVKIGCPNSHVDQIEAISDNIKKIKYMSEDGGSYIRVDFDDSYGTGARIKFSYSIHQSYMYIIEEDEHLCRYSFTPGWFEEIVVDHIRIRWDDSNVISSTAHSTEGHYLVWEGSLYMGERLNASVKYNLDTFDTDKDKQFKEGDQSMLSGKVILAIIIIVIVAIVVLCIIFGDDDYGGRGGFRSTTVIHSHSRCAGCAGCASCACACACAGGGRAGCSMKDFYHTNLDVQKLKKVLKAQ